MKQKTRETIWILCISPICMLLFGPLVVLCELLSKLNLWIMRGEMILRRKFIEGGQS